MFGIGMEYIVALLIVLGIAVVVLLIIRELVCWYFKINEHIQDQWKQLNVLKKILVILEQQEARANTVNLAALVPQLPPKADDQDGTGQGPRRSRTRPRRTKSDPVEDAPPEAEPDKDAPA